VLHQRGEDADWRDLTTAGHQPLIFPAEQTLIPEKIVNHDFRNLSTFLNDFEHRQFSGKILIRVKPVEEI
jgi:NADPH2:quinone reductase